MSEKLLVFGSIPLGVYARAIGEHPARPRWKPFLALASIFLASAGSYSVGVWDGRRTTALTQEQAISVLGDSRMSANKASSALGRIMFLTEQGLGQLDKTKTRADGVGSAAREYLHTLQTRYFPNPK